MKKTVFYLVASLTILFFSYSDAVALRIIPPRIVMGPDVDIEYIYIKNNADKVKKYRFGWRHLAMEPDGKVINLDKLGMDKVPGYRAADKIIRFSPRSTVLQPGETQRVTLMVRRTPDLTEGEYRSHFFVQQMPLVNAKEKIEKAPSNKSKVNVEMLVSRAFPVYVFHGNVEASLQLESAVLKRNLNKKAEDEPDHYVYFDVLKQGNRSIIATAEVLCGQGEGAIALSKVPKSMAVYAEGSKRSEEIPIYLPEGGCSAPRLIIKAHRDDPLQGTVLIEDAIRIE